MLFINRISTGLLNKIAVYFLMLTLFLISFPRLWSLYALGGFLFVGLLLWIRDFKYLMQEFLHYWYLVAPPIFYFLVQLLNSLIVLSPVILLVDRLMFILVPIFGFPFFSKCLDKPNLRKILLSYIAGITIIGIFLLLRLSYIILSEANCNIIAYLRENMFSYLSDGFSGHEHPTYFSLKIVWIFILFYLMKDGLEIKKYVWILILLLLSFNIFLLSSKAGMLSWMIVNTLFFALFINKKVNNKIIKYSLVTVFFAVAFYLIFKNDRFKLYVDQVQINLEAEKVDWKNLDQRTREWYTSYNLIIEKPLIGYGRNKIEGKMVESYNKYGFKLEADLKMNAHNQFLETQATFGLLGTLSLLWMLLTLVIFRNRFRYENLCLAFFILISFYLSIESMFNRQWGIMFFLLFYFILTIPSKNIYKQ